MAPGFFQGAGNTAADKAGWDGFPVTASAGISEELFICLAGRWILRWNGAHRDSSGRDKNSC